MKLDLVQVELRDGTAIRTCWVEARVKVGDSITLRNCEEPARLWRVMGISTVRKRLTEIPRGWNNNI